MTHHFTDADLQSFADAIARLPAPVPRSNGKLGQDRGLAALVQKCRSISHNADLAGRDNVPRIAAQREDFLIKTLVEYKNNTRHGYDGSMAEVLQPVSEAEIRDLAYFISRQP